MPPIARILSIGDELLLGRTVDTNAAWLARRLGDRGLAVDRIVQVGDGEKAIRDAMQELSRGAALLVCTGGLGPTDDDRTRHALAAAVGDRLVEDPAAWAAIRRRYRSLRRGPMPESNRRQALRPRRSVLLPNDRGTAPGLLDRIGRCQVACLPGVPHEMMAMLERLARRLPRLLPGLHPPAVGECWFSGLGESRAQDLLAGLLTEAHPRVGITVSELGHITLRVLGTSSEVRRRLAELRARLRPWLLPQPGLAPSLVELCARRGLCLTAAESCTAGHLVAQIAAVPGASRVLKESRVVYHDQAKRSLGVPARVLRCHGAVSEATVRALAECVRRRTGADLALATSGVAGPGGGSPAKPVGGVWLAAANARETVARLVRLPGDRERVQRRAAAAGLQLAWELMQGAVEGGLKG